MYDQVFSRTSAAWNIFTVFNFGFAAIVMADRIHFLDATFVGKGFSAMSALLLVHTTAGISKLMRDYEEVQRLHNKLQEASN